MTDNNPYIEEGMDDDIFDVDDDLTEGDELDSFVGGHRLDGKTCPRCGKEHPLMNMVFDTEGHSFITHLRDLPQRELDSLLKTISEHVDLIPILFTSGHLSMARKITAATVSGYSTLMAVRTILIDLVGREKVKKYERLFETEMALSVIKHTYNDELSRKEVHLGKDGAADETQIGERFKHSYEFMQDYMTTVIQMYEEEYMTLCEELGHEPDVEILESDNALTNDHNKEMMYKSFL